MLWFAYRGEQRQTMHRHTMYQQIREIRHKKYIVCKQTRSVRPSFSTICRHVDRWCWIEYQVQNDLEQPTLKIKYRLSEHLGEQVPSSPELELAGYQRYRVAYQGQLSGYYVLYISKVNNHCRLSTCRLVIAVSSTLYLFGKVKKSSCTFTSVTQNCTYQV